jgi:hypothetical protein
VPQDRDIHDPLVEENDDRHLEVFAAGNGAFCNRWQETPGNATWRHEGWNAKKPPSPSVRLTWLEAALNLRRRLEVIGFGDDGALWHAWQIDTAPNWSSWESLKSPPEKIRREERLTIGTNSDGRLAAFVIGQDDALWHIAQVQP